MVLEKLGSILKDTIKKIASAVFVDESLLDKPYEEQEEFVVQYLESLKRDTIIGKFEHYIRTRAEIEEKSREDKLKEDYQRFKEALSIPHNGTGKGTEAR